MIIVDLTVDINGLHIQPLKSDFVMKIETSFHLLYNERIFLCRLLSADVKLCMSVCPNDQQKALVFFIRFNKAGTTQNEDRKGHANE